VRLTRAELEAMVRPALSDSIEALKRALRSANVTPDQLHSVLLVGGSSRMPLVAQLVGAELGRPVAVDAHPKHAVALGAAWLASGALSATAEERAVTGKTGAVAASGTATRGTASVGAAAVTPDSPTILPAATPSVTPVVTPVAASTRSSGTASVPVAQSPLASTQMGGAVGGSVYGGPPAAPAPATGGKRRPFPLIAAGVALLLVLGGGGLALALTRNNNNNQGQGQGGPTTGPGTSAPATTAAAPVVPADEQCSDAIKSNPRWVCLTNATLDGEKIVIEYEAEWNGSNPSISNGFHLHIYGGDGREPPDRIMGTHANNPGDWYVEDEQPSVKSVGSDEFRNAGLADAEKVCARIARSGHQLVKDASGKNTYRTGNCVPITRTG
jgi:molecular chaperone DnaK